VVLSFTGLENFEELVDKLNSFFNDRRLLCFDIAFPDFRNRIKAKLILYRCILQLQAIAVKT